MKWGWGEACNPSFTNKEVNLRGESPCCKVTRQLENAELGPRTILVTLEPASFPSPCSASFVISCSWEKDESTFFEDEERILQSDISPKYGGTYME